MISLDQYWMGRDSKYPADLTDEIRNNAQLLLARVNDVLARAAADHVEPGLNAQTGTPVASGWRPQAVNDATSNAGKSSKHITGHGIDIRDTVPGRTLARWCLLHKAVLEEVELWMEDPRWTPTWVHLQSIAPGSGNRVFVPSNAPALAAPLPEQRIA